MQSTKVKLSKARARAAEYAAKYGEQSIAANWRYWAKPNNVAKKYYGNWGASYNGLRDCRPYYVESLAATGWRQCGDASQIMRAAGFHRAASECDFYADNCCSDVIKSAVLQLPSRNDEPVYIAGHYSTDSDGATVYPLDSFDNIHDAAQAAARYAERAAEASRDYYARDAAEQDIEQARADIHTNNGEALQLIKEIKKAGASFSPAICSALRAQLGDYIEQRRAAFGIIEARQNDHWSAVNY